MDNQVYVLLSEIRDLLREQVELQKRLAAHQDWEARMIAENLGFLNSVENELPTTLD